MNSARTPLCLPHPVRNNLLVLGRSQGISQQAMATVFDHIVLKLERVPYRDGVVTMQMAVPDGAEDRLVYCMLRYEWHDKALVVTEGNLELITASPDA